MKRAFFVAVGLGSLALAYACVGDEPSAPTAVGDAATAETSVGDGGSDGPVGPPTDAAPCDLSLEFSVLEPLTSLNGLDDQSGPTLTHDELQIIYATNRGEPSPPTPASEATNLWGATRKALDDPFGAASTTLTGSLNVFGKLDSDPVLSDDGLLLVWAQRELDAGNNHILRYARRDDQSQPFHAAGILAFGADGGPPGQFPKASALLPNGALYFATRIGTDTDYRIYRAARGSGVGNFDVAVEQTLSSGGPIHAETAVVTADETTMYVGLVAGADIDVAVLKRPDAKALWGAPQTLPKLSSGTTDRPRWLSPDGCRLYVASSRPGGAGEGDLYVARRK